MSVEQGGFGVSTDAAGVLAGPGDWRRVWDHVEDHENFLGLEVLGWRWAPVLLERNTLPVIGVHGRTGGIHDCYNIPHQATLGLLNGLILSTPELVTEYGARDGYVLIHSPEIRKTVNYIAITGDEENGIPRPDINLLFIENHIRPGALGAAVESALKLRARGVRVGVMMDVFHLLSEYDGHESLNERWADSLHLMHHQLEALAKYPDVRIGFHIPMGTKVDDSLPIAQLSPNMWRDLGNVMHCTQERGDIVVVIEDQQAGLGAIGGSPTMRNKVRSYNQMIFDLLGENGVIR